MSSISSLANRYLPNSLLNNTAAQDDGKNTAAATRQAQGSVSSTPTSLSSGALDLQQRLESVGNDTIDYAQSLMNSFAQNLFGDGANIDFDSASLEAQSSFGIGALHSEDASGVTDAAAFRLADSSHFIGKGTITTADGRKFDFEIEVKYSYELTAGAAQTSSGSDALDGAGDAASGKPVSTNDLPTVQVPNIDFPGTLSDLFKLIGRDLQSIVSDRQGGTTDGNSLDRGALRNLSLRLLNLVDSKDKDTYEAPAADQSKAVNDAYGVTPGGPAGAVAAAPVESTTVSGTAPAAQAGQAANGGQPPAAS
ncbi:hypothetical protein ACLB1G_18100 [Oxalobacteraceae bacterium A2-2]